MEDQAAVPHRTSGKERGSSGELPHGLPATLPDLPGKEEMPPIPTDLTPEAPKWDNKCPHDDDNEIMEVLDDDKPAAPPKKKKKKKNKEPKEAVPTWKDEDEGTRPSTSTVEPKDVADEANTSPGTHRSSGRGDHSPKKRRRNRKRMPISRSSG